MGDVKAIKIVGAWRHTHSGKFPGGGPVIELCGEYDPEHDVTLLYERGKDTPTWSMPGHGGAPTLLDAKDNRHGMIVAIA